MTRGLVTDLTAAGTVGTRIRPTRPLVNGLPSLADRRIVFVDCRAALDAARAAGIGPDTEVRTTAPALLLDPSPGLISAEKGIAPARRGLIVGST